jgi:predicted O-linked N-acetylglucosamine transferase (SPINDLY family)
MSALACHRRGQLDEAEARYRQILAQRPDCFDALNLLAVCAIDRNEPREAACLARRALAVDRTQASAQLTLARALMMVEGLTAALECASEAIRLAPARPDAWFMRGNILFGLGLLEASADNYERALDLQPSFPEALNNYAAACRALRRARQALASAERALALDPTYAKAYNNRGLIHLDDRRTAAAIEDFRRALACQPEFAEAMHNLGTALMQRRSYGEACDAFQRLAMMAPRFPRALGNLLRARLGCCDWRDFHALVDAIRTAVERGENADLPLSFLSICGSAAAQLTCARRYTDANFPALPVEHRRAASVAQSADRPIRIAYLSGDFGEHAVSYLLAGLFERHDRRRFETIALSWDRVGEGPMRLRLEQVFTRFMDITGLGDADVVAIMRDLQVDIAVDLSGHTFGQRTGIFARRAAPIQVNYLGFPGSMGAGYIDYLIADEFLVPASHRQHYSEQIVWLPCFQPNDDRRTEVPKTSRREQNLPEQGFVFGSFNTNSKLTPDCFEIWMRLLGGVPGSVLWMLADHELARTNLQREAQIRGIDPRRLIFAARVSYAQHLARLALIDLCLDTVPFNGGTTTSDALHAGVPVITCAGESFSARMSAGLLSRLELPELITTSMQQYEMAALQLATQPARLGVLRAHLARLRQEHVFFDTQRYCGNLESAYERMWARHAAGLAAASFAVID